MEQQVLQFMNNHWTLCLAFAGILVLVGINELIHKKRSPKALSVAAAVESINHQHAVVIDLRDKELYRAGHILGASCMTAEELTKNNAHKTSPLILVCARGLQSAALAVKLSKQGFTQPMILAGGMSAWQTAGFPLVKGNK
jgi:rhodanese-related sulfurtransferase